MTQNVLTLSQIVTYALIPCIIVLGTAIAAMYRQGLKRQEKIEDKWDECETRHSQTMVRVIELSEKVGHLEGRIAGQIEGAQTLADTVIARLDARNTGT